MDEDEGAIDDVGDRLFDQLAETEGGDAAEALSADLLDHLLGAEDEAALRRLLDGDALALIDDRPLARSLENAVFAVRADAELQAK